MRDNILAAGVVIRFQICIFDILNTAHNDTINYEVRL